MVGYTTRLAGLPMNACGCSRRYLEHCSQVFVVARYLEKGAGARVSWAEVEKRLHSLCPARARGFVLKEVPLSHCYDSAY
jgi:hypothetical protein